MTSKRGMMMSSDIEGEDSDGSLNKEEHGSQELRLVRVNDCRIEENPTLLDPTPMPFKLNQIVGESTEEQEQIRNGFLEDQGILAQASPLLTNVIPAGVLEIQTTCNEDSVDGSPSPREDTAHCDAAHLDVMLESVDLRGE